MSKLELVAAFVVIFVLTPAALIFGNTGGRMIDPSVVAGCEARHYDGITSRGDAVTKKQARMIRAKCLEGK